MKLFLLLLLTNVAIAQELNCVVNLNTDQLASQQTTDAQYFGQLKGVMTEFMNARRWTTDEFRQPERINCTLNITLLRSTQQGAFDATAQFVVSRPIYGTNYETPTLSYVDRAFNFYWMPTSPVFFRDNQYADELTSLMAFYANIALAVDYDSFGRLGGNPYVQQAYNIATLAGQNGSGQGWNPNGDRRNRYFLVENMQNQQLRPFREGFYEYHRLALDQFAQKPAEGRQTIMNFLTTVQQITQQLPGLVLVNSFFDAKTDELTNILFEGTPDERRRAYALLAYLNPGKTEAYRRLLR